MLKRIGFEEEANIILNLWKRGQVKEAADAVSDELLAKTCVFGSKDEAQEKLIQFIRAGATTPLLTLPFHSKVEYGLETYHALAPNSLSL